ncbi:MAG: DUF721 domain-containing protein [Magnetospirillum sp.]|nr:DUF721 domain-containing protein [Magnetospirillum sp.]
MTSATDSAERRTNGLVAIAVPAGRATRGVFGGHGFVDAALVVDWPAIVGPAVAAHTLPSRIKFPPKERAEGTLVVKVASSAFATDLQHLEPLVLERINGHFGYRAVARLQLRHGPLPRARSAPAAPRAGANQPPGDLTAALARVDDPELRDALERLGRRLGG